MKTFSVRLPNGKIVKNIPEGTTRDTIRAKFEPLYPDMKWPKAEEKELLLDKEHDVEETYRKPPVSQIAGLDADAQTKLLKALRDRESTDNYANDSNKGGYTGAYQFGVMALVDVGVMNDAKYRKWHKEGRSGGQKAYMSDPDNWDYPGGKDAWLGDKEAQDDAMVKMLNINKSRLKKKKAITKDTSPEDLAGYLTAAHLGGWSNATQLALNPKHDFKDANGTSIREYFALGKSIFGEPKTKKES